MERSAAPANRRQHLGDAWSLLARPRVAPLHPWVRTGAIGEAERKQGVPGAGASSQLAIVDALGLCAMQL